MTVNRPFSPGMEVANLHGAKGTIGILVSMAGSQRTFALSCSHVLARFGSSVSNPDEEIIVQPSAGAASVSERTIGKLSAVFSRKQAFDAQREDVALAELTTDKWLPEIPEIGQPSGWQRHFQNGSRVWRYGAVSRRQSGTIIRLHPETISLDVIGSNAPAVSYRGLFSYSITASPGDSGAAVLLENTQEVIGLHIGGNPASGIGYFFPLEPVFRKYHLDLVKK